MGGSLSNFNFLNVNPQIFQRNRKVQLSNCLEKKFHNICNINLRIIRRRNYSYCEFLRQKFFFLSISDVDEINTFFI